MQGVTLVEEDALLAEGVAVVAEVGHVDTGGFFLADHPALLHSLNPRQHRHYVVVHLAGTGVKDAHSIRQTWRKKKIILYSPSKHLERRLLFPFPNLLLQQWWRERGQGLQQ